MLLAEDSIWMRRAIALAHHAEAQGEVPVGAVLVRNNEIISEGFNQPISLCDPTAHAEVIALREAAKQIHNYRLLETTLYVTLEPCVMCLGALIHARVKRVVFACEDPRAGAISQFKLLEPLYFNHAIDITSGVLRDECASIIKAFFIKKRG